MNNLDKKLSDFKYGSPAITLTHPQRHFEISINTACGWNAHNVRKVLEEHDFNVISIEEDKE